MYWYSALHSPSLFPPGSIVFIVFMILMLVIIVLIVIIQDIWWLVDLIIFATNQRDAGNGCMLQDNL